MSKDDPIRITVFGDSLTEGFGLSMHEALPSVLEEMLFEQGTPARLINLGVSGDTTADGVHRLKQAVKSKPDAVILEFGANDSFLQVPVHYVEKNLRIIIEEFQKLNIPILLAGMNALSELGETYKNEFDPIFPRLASEYDIDLYPNVLDGYFGKPDLLLQDELHPNAAGIRKMASKMLPLVEKLVQKVKIN